MARDAQVDVVAQGVTAQTVVTVASTGDVTRVRARKVLPQASSLLSSVVDSVVDVVLVPLHHPLRRWMSGRGCTALPFAYSAFGFAIKGKWVTVA